MNENLVQKLLDDYGASGAWLDVLDILHVTQTWSDDRRLVSLKYDQTQSPMDNPLVCQCRGMVVDVHLMKVVAWPYDKFWNLGEGRAAPVDWPTAKCLEKLDGSLMIMFYDRVEAVWRVASSGHPTAGGRFGTHESWSFGDAFRNMFTERYSGLPSGYESYTFMFELCAPENRIVVRHEQRRLVLHGARDLTTGEEMSLEWLEFMGQAWGWEIVKSFPLASVSDCQAAALALRPHESEGFVVVDAVFNRIKIKSPSYVAVHHLRGEFSSRRAVELWQTGETSELVAHFPEFAEVITQVHDRLEDAVAEVYVALTPRGFWEPERWPDRKTFAMMAKETRCPAACFSVFGRRTLTMTDLRAIMRVMKTSVLESLL